MHTYLFYDIESSGLSKCFDQVMQFAAIRTDLELREIERYEFLIKVNADIIPSPFASTVHHIPLKKCEKEGIPEFKAMEQIHALLNTPGTISLGYNTLAFDDEFLRFSFYRNLLTPYTHQYANNCSRMDVYPMMVMYYLFKPGVLEWPQKNGQPSMKLENISAMNKLAEGPAHDAMVDVLATLELARRLKAEPQMWGYLTGYFDKKIDADRIHKLPSKLDSNAEYALGLFVLPKLGNKCQWCAPVISIGQHHHYKNQTLWLRLDLPELAVTTAESIDKTTWALSKKLGDVGFVLPMTDHYTQHVKQKRKDIAMTNLAWIKENPELFQAVCDYHQERKYEVYPHTDVDAVLYQSKFWTSQETKLCGQFHREPDEQKSKIIDQLDNPDLREMAIRALGRYNPEFLSAGQRAEFDTYLKACFTQDEAKVAIDFTQTPRYNLPQFYQDIVDVRKKKLTEAQEALIKELEARLG